MTSDSAPQSVSVPEHGRPKHKELRLNAALKPIAPEAPGYPATPATLPWKPRCSKKAAPPPLTRVIIFTPTNQTFSSAYEYVEETKARRQRVIQACKAQSDTLDLRTDPIRPPPRPDGFGTPERGRPPWISTSASI